MSTISSGTDLTSKYQKLAAEYSKLRAHVPVLKKAFLDEQKRNSDLNDELRTKDQCLRKVEAEIESLVFRNQQLTRRVEYLQEKFEELSSPKLSKKGHKKSDDFPRSQSSFAVSSGQTVLQEELANKLAENAKLHTQIFELQQSQEQELHGFEEKMRAIEAENVSLQKELASIKNRHQAVLEELRSDKTTLETDLDILKTELNQYRKKYDELCSSTTKELGVANKLLSERLIFNDSEDRDLNKLNVVSTDQSFAKLTGEVFDSVKNACQQIFSGYGNCIAYMEQRSQLYPCDISMENISETNQKFSVVLKSASGLLRPLSDSVIRFCEMCQSDCSDMRKNIEAVISTFGDFVTYWRRDIFPLFEKTIEEECAVSWCNHRLEKENRLWEGCLTKFVDALDNFGFVICPLMTATDETVEENIDNLIQGLEEFSKTATDLSNQYSMKVTCEHQLPTATKRLRTTNECLLASLNSTAKHLAALTETCAKQREFLVSFLSRALNCVPGTDKLAQQAERYLDQVTETVSSIPVVSSSYSLQTVLSTSDDELKNLKSEIEKKNRRLAELEREKEHWAVEIQLLKVKFQGQISDSPQTKSAKKVNVDEAGMEPGMDAFSGVADPSGDVGMVEEYYGKRIEEMMCQLQATESRASYFQQECGQLLRSMQVGQKQREKLQKDLKESAEEITRLKDELETTRQGYEGQMNSLSEHLAQMNQKLTTQTDEIDMLRQAINEKNHAHQKKSRFK